MTGSPSEIEAETETDGGAAVELDQDELYATVRTAVQDALLDVIGTLFLLGLALLFVAVGIQALLAGFSTASVAVAVAAIGGSTVLAAVALEVIPLSRG